MCAGGEIEQRLRWLGEAAQTYRDAAGAGIGEAKGAAERLGQELG